MEDECRKIISIQKNWKSLGSAGQKYDNKLWADFRSACDDFFAARERNFAAQEAALIENLTAKMSLLLAYLK